MIDSKNLNWAVCAGAAAYLYGDRRPIQDVDLVVENGQLSAIVQLLQQAQKAVQFDGKRILWRGIKVVDDLSIRTTSQQYPFQLDATAIERLRRMPLLGAQVRVLAPEDVLAQKIAAARGESEGKHDLSDAAGIIRRQQLDLAYLARRFQLMKADRAVYDRVRDLGIELPASGATP